MGRFARAIASACFVVTLSAASQPVHTQSSERPNFSGQWKLTSGGTAEGPLLGEGIIEQEASTVVFTTSTGKLSYRLDGRDSANTITTANGATWKLVSQARWVTNALLITTKYDAGTTGRWEDVAICSLDRDGQLNVVTVNASLSDQRAMVTTQLRYRKN